MGRNSINISDQPNKVFLTDQNNRITVTNNTCNKSVTVELPQTNINLQQGYTNVLNINTVGPQGPVGPTGPQGPAGEGQDTGSFIITASSNNTNRIQYTKGDGSTFDNTINNVVNATSASYIAGSNVDGAVANATNATNANKVYVDYGDTSTTAQLIPTYTADGGVDGYKDLKVSNNPLAYYYRTTNNITGISNQADELHIGGGANTAGAIFLNSTVGNYPTYIRTDNHLHFKSTGNNKIISNNPFNISSSLYIDGIVDVTNSTGSTYQVGLNQHIIFNTFVGGADSNNPAILYLPTVGKSENMQIRFLTDGTLANNNKEVHIYPNAADTTTIDGSSHYELERPYDGVMLMCHNANWWVIQRKSK